LEQGWEKPGHYNQSVMLRVLRRLDAAVMRQAIEEVVNHHDGLRMRFQKGPNGWKQRNASHEGQRVFEQIDLSGVEVEQGCKTVETIAEDVQGSLHLERGPVLRVAYFRMGDGQKDLLLIVIHHLVVDGVSWRILLEDLQTAYAWIEQGKAVKLPAKTASFQRWAEGLADYARQPGALEQERQYWLGLGADGTLPRDHNLGTNTVASARTITERLETEDTRALLQEVPKVYRVQIEEALLGMAVAVLSGWSGHSKMRIYLEGHGREEIPGNLDVSRSVGWFTTLYPVEFETSRESTLAQKLWSTKERLRGVPHRGIGYGILRYLQADSDTARRLRSVPAPEVTFNYLGRFDFENTGLFASSTVSSGAGQHSGERRPAILDIVAGIVDEQLIVNWTYSQALHAAPTIQALADQFLKLVRDLVQQTQGAVPETTSHQFPLANIDQRQFSEILNQMHNSKTTIH
jgi:non-ribosomal peptide synthase protein (TIGR01720 family)